jgi:AcrR family transcriptional regulator
MPQTKMTDKNGKSAKWQRRRREIVDASAKVFADRGYHATSTTELCEANGIGKGALYYYIGSKEELLAAIHDRVMDEVMLGADRADRAGGTPPQRLAMLGEELLDVIFRFPDHVWVFLHDFPALTGKNAEMFRQRRRTYERRVEVVFREGVESGDFRPLDTRLAVTAWLGMHNYTYLGLRAGEHFSVKDAAKSFADIFVWGIATRGLTPAGDPRARISPQAAGLRYPVTA